MRKVYGYTLLLVIIGLFVSGCVVQVRPIPVLHVHPLELELSD